MGGRAALYRCQPQSVSRPQLLGAQPCKLASSHRQTSARAVAEPPVSDVIEKAHRDQFIRNGDTETSYVQLQVLIPSFCAVYVGTATWYPYMVYLCDIVSMVLVPPLCHCCVAGILYISNQFRTLAHTAVRDLVKRPRIMTTAHCYIFAIVDFTDMLHGSMLASLHRAVGKAADISPDQEQQLVPRLHTAPQCECMSINWGHPPSCGIVQQLPCSDV